MILRRAPLFAIVLLVGCKATIPSGRFACAESADCPAALECVEGLCGAPMTPPDEVDAGSDGSASGTDASVSASEDTAQACADGVDNDDDGASDCRDPGCCAVATRCGTDTLCGCATGEIELATTRAVPTIHLLVDSSESMLQLRLNDSQPRWVGLVNALTQSGGVLPTFDATARFGMMLFAGVENAATCPDYRDFAPARPSAVMLQRALQDNPPVIGRGVYPSDAFPRLQAERDALLGTASPRHVIYFVDTPPLRDCRGQTNTEQQRTMVIQAASMLAADGIRTSVIGIGNSFDGAGQAFLDDIAAAAGTTPARRAMNTSEIRDTTAAIVAAQIPCTLTLAGAVRTSEAARGSVAVDGVTLTYGAPTDGWNLRDETTIELLGAACTRFQRSAAPVAVSYPCDALAR